MSRILYIDTTDSSITKVALEIDGKRKELSEQTDHRKSQNVLPLIEKLLNQEKITFSQLTAINVAIGSGSFTGIRVGVTVANTLGWALSIPVNGKPAPLIPTYDFSVFDNEAGPAPSGTQGKRFSS